MSVLLFIAVLVLLIVVHELGHFLVARLFGIRVDEFGVGYPPRAFTLGTYKKTTYTLNWLPFGGFVRIFGEQRDREYSPEEVREAFVYKSRWVQAAVLVAGVFFNVVFAWVLFTGTLLMGAPTQVDETSAVGLETQLVISSVIVGSPAHATGLLAGDEIVGVTTSEATLEDLRPSATAAFIKENVGEEIGIEYIRDLETRAVERVQLVPAHGVLDETPGTPAVGIAMALITNQQLPLGTAMIQSLENTWNALQVVTVGLLSFFASALTGSADWSHVAGPVGIAGLIGDASSVGIVYLMHFTAFISINLAVINLLPLPALDGGRLILVALEGIRGKAMPQNATNVINLIGFAFIIFLMLIVTYYDIVALFS